MVITLAENIRKCRKERALTQEQLAEVLGVTTGAVYKWEAKLSLPELELIVRMATSPSTFCSDTRSGTTVTTRR